MKYWKLFENRSNLTFPRFPAPIDSRQLEEQPFGGANLPALPAAEILRMQERAIPENWKWSGKESKIWKFLQFFFIW